MYKSCYCNVESKLVSPAQPIKWHVETCVFLHMFLEQWSWPFWTIWWCVGSAWLIESVSATSRLHPIQLLENYWIFLHSAQNPPECGDFIGTYWAKVGFMYLPGGKKKNKPKPKIHKKPSQNTGEYNRKVCKCLIGSHPSSNISDAEMEW